VAIGVRETQDIIRQVVVQSRQEVARPGRLEPQEAGMATGPRFRHRSLDRPGLQPDYLITANEDADPWRRLDDDIYKFLQFRKTQFGEVGQPPSYQFLAEVEVQLKRTKGDYELGNFLGLVRLAADLDQTGTTFVTASELGALHALWRRAAAPTKAGEHFDPNRAEGFRMLLQQGDATTLRGLADLVRLVGRAARLPLMGNALDVPSLSVTTLMQVTDLAMRFNQAGQGRFEFQVSPMDVFLGARSVLFNRSVVNPTLTLLRELVLEDGGLYHDDLLEWLQSVGTFGSELTLLMPDSLCAEGYSLPGGKYSALEMVSAGGARLMQAPGQVDKTLGTLSDALIFRIQKQDQHKDHQIQVLLNHFNRLLQGERRSAARISAERKQARFDYMEAIQRASKLAQDLQTGTHQAMQAPLRPGMQQGASISEVNLGAASESSDALVKPKPDEFSREILAEWDETLQTVRRRLSSKSPVFKSMVAQIAKVRSIDTCLSYGLTPGGSRCIGRFSRLIQSEDLFNRLGLGATTGSAVQAALGAGDASYLSSLESLISGIYGFKNQLENLQFRYRDRMSDAPSLNLAADSGGAEVEPAPAIWGEENALDEAGLGLLLSLMGLEESAQAQERAVRAGRGEPTVGDPFTAYIALLAVCQARTQQLPVKDPAQIRHFLRGMDGEAHSQWYSHRNAFRAKLGRRAVVIPLLQGTLRPGWYLGCERGYMKEVKEVVERAGGELDRQLLMHFTEVQSHLDRLCLGLETDKARASQQRLKELLGT
jgi:hypothetical protein